jgi:hypothetical protein
MLPDRIFATRAAKHAAITREISARHTTGQPLLIGTRTIENSESLVEGLMPLGLTLRVLNAKQDAEEAAIIERAGEPGAITIATNMAGRGAHPVPEESVRRWASVIGLERHEARGSTASSSARRPPGPARQRPVFPQPRGRDLLPPHPDVAAASPPEPTPDELLRPIRHSLPPRPAKVEAIDLCQRRAWLALINWLRNAETQAGAHNSTSTP